MRASAERSAREMAEFKNEMAEFKNEMAEFKNEMAEFKNEMRRFAERSDRDRVDFNRRLGGIANAQGRLVEDIVCPGSRSALRGFFDLKQEDFIFYGIRIEKPHSETGLHKEFDLIAAWHTGWLICEAKSRLRPEAIQDMVQGLPQWRAYFPEHAERKLYGCIASLHVDPSLVTAVSKAGILLLGVGEELMEVLNTEGSELRAF